MHPIPEGRVPYPVSLGLDIGSLSTNVVLIDDANRVIARRYLPTASKPLEAIRQECRKSSKRWGTGCGWWRPAPPDRDAT
ncbi:MAG: hypothetical protein R2751_18800 [Bacteroidales bacterium]